MREIQQIVGHMAPTPAPMDIDYKHIDYTKSRFHSINAPSHLAVA